MINGNNSSSCDITIAEKKFVLVSDLPSDDVYKSFNFLVGNGGYGDSKNIENPVVCLKVEKSWIKDNNIDWAPIILKMYNDTKRDSLSTSLSGEDDTYLYLIAEIPGFYLGAILMLTVFSSAS